MIFETVEEQTQFLRTQSWLLEGLDHVQYLSASGIRDADESEAPISTDAELVAAAIFGGALMVCDALKNGRGG
jgi:hypothetical protein